MGDEDNYYRFILLFPFFILPIQLHFNIVMDDRLRGISIFQNYVPYLICGVFFIQSFIRKYIEENWNLNLYDFGLSLAVFVFAVISHDIGKGSLNNDFGSVIFKINFALTLLPNVASMLTRKNIHSAGFLAAIFIYFSIAEIAGQTKKVYENLKEISLTTWAAFFMSCSFALLILGFFASLMGGKRREKSR